MAVRTMSFPMRGLRQASAAMAAALLTACALQVAGPPAPPPIRIPTPEEIFRLQQEKSGKAPVAERAAPDGIQVVFQTGHAGAISSVAMSPNGRYILSSAWDETARLWDVASGQEVRSVTGLGMTGGNVAFVSDAERIVAGSLLEGHRLIDSTTGRTLRELGSIDAPAAISGNGRFAAVVAGSEAREGRNVSSTSLVSIHDLVRDEIIATLTMRGRAAPLTVSNDGRSVVVRRLDLAASQRAVPTQRDSVGTLWQVEIWDVDSRRVRNTFPLAAEEGLSPVLSPDGRLLATGTHTGEVRLYSTATGEQQLELSSGGLPSMRSLVFSPDGRLLGSAALTGMGNMQDGARVWEIPSGRLVASFDASAVNFSADGRTLIVGRQAGGAPVLRDLATGKESPLQGGASAVVDLAVIGEGASVAAATELGGVRHWDLRTGQLLRTFDCPGGTGTRSVSASSVGPWLAAACNDGGVYVWDLQSDKPIRTLNPPVPGKLGVMATVRFDPSGRRIAVSINEQLALWDVSGGHELRRITLPRGRSPLMPASNETATTEEALRESEALLKQSGITAEWQHAVRTLAFHPGGRYLAVAKMDAMTLLVDTESGEVIRRFSRGALTDHFPAQETASSGNTAMLTQLLGGRGLSRKQKKALEDTLRSAGMEAGGSATTAPLLRPPGATEDLLDAFDMVESLAFTPDGRRLLTLGTRGKHVWDVESGKRLDEPSARTAAGMNSPYSLLDPSAMLESIDFSGARSSGLAVAADGGLAAQGHGNLVKLLNLESSQEMATLAGHTSDVTSVAYAAKGRLLVSGSRDGTLRVWNVPTAREVVQLIALSASDYVAVTPDQYYRASKRGISGVAFRLRDRVYPFEQFDMRFNRPDIVLERLDGVSAEVLQTYRAAWQRRLKKLGLPEGTAGRDLQLPEVSFGGASVPVSTSASSITLRVRASDSRHALDRINLFVNDVPVYGTSGLKISLPEALSVVQDIQVPLVPGHNKVQVSVLNRQGTESLKQTAYTTSTAEAAPADIYIVAIGVSRYQHSAYNLRFAAKDAADLAAAYEGIAAQANSGGRSTYGRVRVLSLTNEKAVRDEIRRAKSWLQQARVNDLVVVFAAGHGMTDARQEYYFGTHDIDPKQPELNGLPYEDFEALLDGIPALKKLLLIDTCFSGEIEKDDPVIVAQAPGDVRVSMRAFKAARGVTLAADTSATKEAPSATADALRFQHELFADLRRGTGAVVISSASGNEYALEGERWSNGVFTYALLNGLRNAHADTNRDKTITVSELQAYVIDEVRKLTAGGQNPTVRRENLGYDFAVY